MRLFICGISGRMGSALCAEAIADGHVIAGGLDVKGGMFPVFSSADEVTTEFDVLVDFSSPSLLPEVIKLIGRTHKPAVICTTGLCASDIEALRRTARISPVFYSENVSRGIGVVSSLVRRAATELADSDVEIIEAHHRNKKDSPSGTAKLLAREICSVRNDLTPIFNRDGKRNPDEIGISSVRGGTICGEHEVIFAGDDEAVIVKHVAYSRKVFARGAIEAALFVIKKESGFYSLSDLYE